MKNLLIVDDNSKYATKLAGYFQKLGYRIEHVTTGQEGIEVLERKGPERYPVLITDITMEKRLAGIYLLYHLWRQQYQGTVVVASTGLDFSLVRALFRLCLFWLPIHYMIPKKSILRGEILFYPGSSFSPPLKYFQEIDEKEEKEIKKEKSKSSSRKVEAAILGGGCFWCVEAIFQEVKGVLEVRSGYAGGRLPNPDYRTVCKGASGHAEVCQIAYDPQIISYSDLLELFFHTHDPTTLNRQGGDVGSQYRSAIFYCNEDQNSLAKKKIEQLERSKLFRDPIVTEVKPLAEFYPAEDYHQNWFKNNPTQPYCSSVIRPKLEKFWRQFPHKTSRQSD